MLFELFPVIICRCCFTICKPEINSLSYGELFAVGLLLNSGLHTWVKSISQPFTALCGPFTRSLQAESRVLAQREILLFGIQPESEYERDLPVWSDKRSKSITIRNFFGLVLSWPRAKARSFASFSIYNPQSRLSTGKTGAQVGVTTIETETLRLSL